MTQKNEIIEWVGRGNTNPAVLGSMIDSLESGEEPFSSYNVLNIINNTNDSISCDGSGVVTETGVVADPDFGPYIEPESSRLFCFCRYGKGEYILYVQFFSGGSDIYNITINGTTVPLDGSVYEYNITSDTPIVGQTFNCTIDSK